MFPLFQKELPVSAQQLATVLSASLSRVLNIPGNPITLRTKAYPDLEEMAIDLTGAQIRMDAPRPPLPIASGETAMSVRHFSLAGHPISLGGAGIDLKMDAEGLVLRHDRDAEDNIILSLHRASNGHIAISIPAEDLETLVAEIAKSEAGKQGVVIEDVLLILTSRGPRSLGAELRIQARKLFLRTTIRIAGQLDIDDQLVARLSALSCNGEGAIGTLACGVLTPQLQKLQTRNFPLLALPLGEVKLRDIRLDTIDGIKVTAEFGSAAMAQNNA